MKMKREFFLKPKKVKLNKRRQTKLDKLVKEGGRIIRPPKNSKQIYSREKGKQSNL